MPQISQSSAAAGRRWQALGGWGRACAVQVRSRAAQARERDEHAMARTGLQAQLTRKRKFSSQLQLRRGRKRACERVMEKGLSLHQPRKWQAVPACAGLQQGFRQLMLAGRCRGRRAQPTGYLRPGMLMLEQGGV